MNGLPPPIAFFAQLPAFDNPFIAAWYIFVHGGWFFVGLTLLAGLWELWCYEIEQHYHHTKLRWLLLAINVPKRSEQTPKSVENIFASLMGLHVSINAWEKYVEGRSQENFACEIASHGGFIQFYMWVPVKTRDVFEAAVFAQYPDAEIHEAEDYTKKYPMRFPNDEWDCWGTELVNKKSECWPIKTYPYFEDKMSGTFKDPLSQLFEVMAFLGPGEELWVQYPIKPIEQDWQQKCATHEVNKLIGEKEHEASSNNPIVKFLHIIAKAMYELLIGAISGVFPGSSEKGPVKKDTGPKNLVLYLTTGQKALVDAIEMKASKLGYDAKIRILYVAKKEVFAKNRKKVITGIMGVFRQFNAHDMNTFGLGKHTFVRAYYYFVQYRLNRRKRILMKAYKVRSNTRGDRSYILNVEELATLWHFPMLDISAPLLQKSEVKRGEPPSRLPLPDYDYKRLPSEGPITHEDDHAGGHGAGHDDAHGGGGSAAPSNLPFA